MSATSALNLTALAALAVANALSAENLTIGIQLVPRCRNDDVILQFGRLRRGGVGHQPPVI